jgi:hypothetical protein
MIGTALAGMGQATVYPAPKGEQLSSLYKVSAGKQMVPVYVSKVAAEDDVRRAKGMDDKVNSAAYFEEAAFAYFDLKGSVTVTVTVPGTVSKAKVLPASAGIVPMVRGKTVSFKVSSPQNLTVEVNGEWVRSLHIFVNPPEKDVPRPDDPNVIYFGPGIHEVSSMVIGDNKTVYVAGGAIVRAVIRPDEKYHTNAETGLRGYAPTFDLRGKNITFRGRGIIDQSACTTHARHMIFMMESADVKLEGVILRDASLWTVPVRRSDRVVIDNIKLLGYRANSDGIDIANSRDVTVQHCFIRTLDDLVVVKSDKGQGEVKKVLVRNCVLWNQVAHALSIGAELRENVSDVLFTDCDIIHDQGREWLLRVYQCDAALVSNVRFQNIRIEQGKRYISLWIGKAVWSRDKEPGYIKDVIFRNIRATGDPLTVQLVGVDKDHLVEDVLFDRVLINGAPLRKDGIGTNDFVKNIAVLPLIY